MAGFAYLQLPTPAAAVGAAVGVTRPVVVQHLASHTPLPKPALLPVGHVIGQILVGHVVLVDRLLLAPQINRLSIGIKRRSVAGILRIEILIICHVHGIVVVVK